MKNRLFKGVAAIVLAASLAFGSVAVPVIPQTATVAEAKAKVKTVNLKVTLGTTYNLKNKKNIKGTVKKVSSSNKKVATVSKKGVITALTNGTTNVSVTTSSGSYKFIVTVPKAKLSKTKATVNVNKTLTLSVSNGKNATWSSSNKKVATVNKKGVVTGKKAGTAKITAKVGNVKLTCNVTVKKAAAAFKQPTIKYSLSDAMVDGGKGKPVGAKLVQAKVTFSSFPKNVNDLKKIDRGSGKGNDTNRQHDGKFITVACALAALAAYSEGRNADGRAMLEYLMVSPTVSLQEVGLAGDLNYYFEPGNSNRKLTIPWVYLDGANQNNNFTPTKPISSTMEEYPYVVSGSSYYGAWLNIEGVRFNDSMHPALKQETDKILLYEDPVDHQWYLWPSGFAQLYANGSVKVPGQP
jgi:hypothetical protein